MSGTHAFLELLKQEGVDIVFGNPGTTELPLIDELAMDNDVPLRAKRGEIRPLFLIASTAGEQNVRILLEPFQHPL